MWAAYLVVAAFAILCGFFFWLYETGIVIIFEPAMDFGVLIVTAAGLILGGVAAGIAALAIFGYQNIKCKAIKAAVKEAIKAATVEARSVAESVGARAALEAARAALDSPTGEEADAIAKEPE
jgi:hypothetical protein